MKCYVLNLETSTDRLADFTACYPDFLPAFEVWRAKPPEECETPEWWKGSPEFNSNRVNMLDVLTACAESGETFYFFEDDCCFSADAAERHEAFMRQVPSCWEVLNLCANHMVSGLYSPQRILPEVLRPRLAFNTNALVLKPSGAAKLKKALEKPAWPCRHIAEQPLGYAYLAPEMRAYSPYQNYIGQRGCWSELCRRYRAERWYNFFMLKDLDGVVKPAPGLYERA